MTEERIVAVGLLTQSHLDALGGSLKRVWAVEETPCFADLLQAIDDADSALRRARETTALGA